MDDDPAKSVTGNDLTLLERWRAGDVASGQALFTRHFQDVYRFFEHKVPADVDDLVQRTFAACVASRDQFRAECSFRTYMFSIARKQLYKFLRQRPKGEHFDFDEISIAAVTTSPPSKVDRANQVELLRHALLQLPAEQQLLLELHYWQDLDAVALGQVFETAPGTIRVRLLRARDALRKQLSALRADIGKQNNGDRLVAALSQPEYPYNSVI